MSRKKSVPPENPVTLLMNKPEGYVCSKVSDSHKTVYELLPDEYKALNPVGRLDAKTTGLLIFTNDGMLNHNLTSPENHIPKTYEVTLEKSVSEEEQKKYSELCEKGILLPPEKKAQEYFAKDMKIKWQNQNLCLITINEGKFHQVRRTFLALENKVLKLKRIAIGEIQLGNLAEGEIQITTAFNQFSKTTH